VRPLRSLLFVPGNRERFLAKLDELRPDAVILDLEDSIPLGEKETAREKVRELLASRRLKDQQLFVRINAFQTPHIIADLGAVVSPRLVAIFLPKVGSADEIREANLHLARAESRAGVEVGSTRLIPIVETVRGIVQVAEIAESSPRIMALNFGYDDFALDLGVPRSPEGIETIYPRARIAITAHAAGVLALDGPRADFSDLEALAEECRVSRHLGFSGKQCIHPTQIEVVNRAFTPSAEEIAQARQTVEEYEAAAAQGIGTIRLGGRQEMVDTPVVERARRLIALAEAIARDCPDG
jgi:citrate lyase subunit beta/citryl-CoA lyase